MCTGAGRPALTNDATTSGLIHVGGDTRKDWTRKPSTSIAPLAIPTGSLAPSALTRPRSCASMLEICPTTAIDMPACYPPRPHARRTLSASGASGQMSPFTCLHASSREAGAPARQSVASSRNSRCQAHANRAIFQMPSSPAEKSCPPPPSGERHSKAGGPPTESARQYPPRSPSPRAPSPRAAASRPSFGLR